MKKILLRTIFGTIFVGSFTFLIPSPVEIASADATLSTEASPVIKEGNPTVLAAIELAKTDSETWQDVIADMVDSDTFLVLPDGGFLQGEMKNLETNEIWNSDTDPNAATLGEIKMAILTTTE